MTGIQRIVIKIGICFMHLEICIEITDQILIEIIWLE